MSNESAMEKAVSSQLTKGHIDKMFQLAELRETNRHLEQIELTKKRPWFVFGTVSLLLFFVLGFSWLAFVYQQGPLVTPILALVVSVLSAAVGSYCYGRYGKPQDGADSPGQK